MHVLRKKTIEHSLEESKEAGHSLRRTLHTRDLAFMGVAVAVGAGIFSVGAQAVAFHAGPAAIISFLIAAVVCGCAALCYAELSSVAPVAGSAYTFTYSTMGELVAWIIGWDMILEMLMAGSVISKYWSVYVNDFLRLLGVGITTSVKVGSITVDFAPIVVIAFFTILLVLGTEIGSHVNNVLAIVKIIIVLFIVVAGFFFIKASNFTPFIPPSEPASSLSSNPEETGVWFQPLFQWVTGQAPSIYGVSGIISGAALVFFAFIGFDVVATASEEAVNPKKTVPRGITLGVIMVTILYVLVAIVTTGMVSYKQLAAVKDPSLTTAFELVGATWAAKVIALGIVIGLTTVVMVLLLGLTRIIFAMSRDGLLPRALSKTSKRGTPARLQIAGSIVVAIMASTFDVTVLSDMVNIGTLSAFMLVALSIPILRRSRPDLERTIKVPGSPVVPILTSLSCLWLMLNLSLLTWVRFLVWLAVGFVIYFSYSYRHSLLQTPTDEHIMPDLQEQVHESH
ncbi:MAG: amino acid permease [Bifidobacteriaceae bacterium]|jgi:APA family basic amino acid/polyamine antiporter|nr:amino acid permease [Bifidobacteriaceae bacterium]MCI1914475.1 amino acid permease [Bifidobacteriaceae bacterium]